MQLLISDANILIDLEEGQLIEHMFQLPYHFAIPDILFSEELEEEHEYVLGLGLHLTELSGETMGYAMELVSQYTKASRNDCFALALARQEMCPLLTGDKALREAASKEAIVVMGTLWLVEQMIRQNLISVDEARLAYTRMQNSGRRLPWTKAETLLVDFEKEQQP